MTRDESGGAHQFRRETGATSKKKKTDKST